MTSEATFTTAGLLAGVRRGAPLAVGSLAFDVAYGVLAREAGLTLPEAVLMSGLVFAGTAQFLALGLWTSPLPVTAIVLTTLMVNARFLLMGASLRRWFTGLPAPKRYGTLSFLSDESWALTMREFAAGRPDAAFMVGCGLVLYVAWVGGTAAGHVVGAALGDPARWGLDFAFTAAFLALLAGFWKGRADLAPWVVAGTVALAAERWLPGTWYILLGGLAGSLVGAVRYGDRDR